MAKRRSGPAQRTATQSTPRAPKVPARDAVRPGNFNLNGSFFTPGGTGLELDRQVIVVTHNANVVVNADAELVTVLEHGTVPVIDQTGAIQESAVRDAICWITEGGETAFQVRYRRLIGPNLN